MWQGGGVWTSADLEAATIAEQQHGVVHGELLRRVGLTSSMVERRLRLGQLRRCAPGVYAFGGSPRTPAQTLVVLALSVGSRGAISHDSAAHLWGMVSRRPGAVHVVVDRWHREHRSDCLVHESLDLRGTDRVWMDGVPVTTASRTVVDLGATSPWLVERALSTSLRLELFTVAEVDAFVKRVAKRGRSGVGIIRPFLDMYRIVGGRTESYLEDRFLRVLFVSQIELPVPQFEIHEQSGRLVCRADFAYPDRQLLIELDGRSYHSDTVAFQRDRDKQNRTQELGWRTLRFTWNDVFRKPDHVATTVSSFLRN